MPMNKNITLSLSGTILENRTLQIDYYPIDKMDKLENRVNGAFKTIHAGYDPAAADADPNVCVPLDALRAYEKEGKIGSIHDYFYSTVGTGTTEAEAARMAQEMIEHLKADEVDAVILTST